MSLAPILPFISKVAPEAAGFFSPILPLLEVSVGELGIRLLSVLPLLRRSFLTLRLACLFSLSRFWRRVELISRRSLISAPWVVSRGNGRLIDETLELGDTGGELGVGDLGRRRYVAMS